MHWPSVRLSVWLAIFLSHMSLFYCPVCLFVNLSVCLSLIFLLYFWPSLCLAICLYGWLLFWPSVCLTVFPSVCRYFWPTCSFFRLSASMSFCLSVFLSLKGYLFVYSPFWLSVCLPDHFSLCLFVSILSVSNRHVRLSDSLYVCPTFYLSFCPSGHLSVWLEESARAWKMRNRFESRPGPFNYRNVFICHVSGAPLYCGVCTGYVLYALLCLASLIAGNTVNFWKTAHKRNRVPQWIFTELLRTEVWVPQLGKSLERRNIRLIEGNAKCRHLKKWPVKGLCGRCLSEFMDWRYSQSY